METMYCRYEFDVQVTVHRDRFL